MTSAFWQAVRDGWQSLARQLWPATPEQEARDALAHLDAELARRYRRLVRRQLRIEQLRDRLAQHERRAADLAFRLGDGLLSGDGPFGAVLSLDRARRAAGRARRRLLAQEQAYLQDRARFDRRKQTRQELQRGLLVPVPPA